MAHSPQIINVTQTWLINEHTTVSVLAAVAHFSTNYPTFLLHECIRCRRLFRIYYFSLAVHDGYPSYLTHMAPTFPQHTQSSQQGQTGHQFAQPSAPSPPGGAHMRHPQHAHPHGLPTSVIQPATSSVNDDWYLNEFSYQQRAKTKKVKKLKSGEAGAKRRSREGTFF